MANSDTGEFGPEILSSGLYRIPDYQRGYAWTKSEVNQLLDDLEYVTNNPSIDSHYLNSVIIAEADDIPGEASYIIDGQQRLLTSVILAHEILMRSKEIGDDQDPDIDQLRMNISDKLDNNVFKRPGRNRIKRRVLPAEEHQEVFKQIIDEDFQRSDLDQIEKDAVPLSPSEQKLINAAGEISSRVEELIDSEAGDTPNKELTYLDRLASTLNNSFTATKYEVEDPSEAGRIFEAINDRGRDLNRADRIKSYIVYRASLEDVNVEVEEIHEKFTYVYERLNEYCSDPSDVDETIDNFIGHHWSMFAGESSIERSDDLVGRHEKVNQDADQMKYATYHIPKEDGISGSRINKWIEVYLESLEDAIDSFVRVRGPDQDALYQELKKELHSDVNEKNVRYSLYAVESFGYATMNSFSMALDKRFSDSDSYQDITKALESFAVRLFGVMGAQRSKHRNDFESLARVLFWEARDDLQEVFPDDSTIVKNIENDAEKYGISGDSDDAKEVIKKLNSWSRSYSYDGDEDVFERRLREENLEGFGVAGWSGLRKKELRNYMLYIYEIEIRGGGMPPEGYVENEIYDYTIEHVLPQNPDDQADVAPNMDEEEYEEYINRLGNYAILSLSENSTADNNNYETKWENVYSEASDGTKMLREELPDPTGGRTNQAAKEGINTWGKDVIEWRSERIADTLSGYWSCSND
jgi:hypothetical protein